MSLPIWPVTLPQKWLKDGYKRANRNRPLVTEMDDGRVVVRKRADRTARREVAAFIMSNEQLEVFEAFYSSGLSEGASRFTMPTPNADRSWSMRTVQIESDQPEITPAGGIYWRVSFPVTVYL